MRKLEAFESRRGPKREKKEKKRVL